MEDVQIIDLYWRRDEEAIRATDAAKASKLPLEIIIPYFLIFVHPFPRLKRENLPAVGAVSGKFTKK